MDVRAGLLAIVRRRMLRPGFTAAQSEMFGYPIGGVAVKLTGTAAYKMMQVKLEG
jgi:hypothetical protein